MENVLNNELDRIGRDEPIDLLKTDLFGTSEKARNISKYIKQNWDALKVNNAIGIKGDWGSGKSSIVKTMVDNDMLGKEYNISVIDAWKHEDVLDIKLNIFDEITSHIKGPGRTALIKGAVWLGRGALSIANDAINQETGIDFSKLKKKNDAVKSMENSITKLNVKKKTVIFVDNIDRMAPKNLVSFINSVKTLFGLFAKKDIIFIVLFDENYLIHSFNEFLKLDEEKSTEYIQKIFVRTFELVPVFERNRFQISDKLFDYISTSLNHNPRSILKFINMYSQIYTIDELKKSNNLILTKVYFLILKIKFPLEFKKLLLVDVNKSNWNKKFNVIIGSSKTPSKLSSVNLRWKNANKCIYSREFIQLIYSTCPSPSTVKADHTIASNPVEQIKYSELFEKKLTSSYVANIDFSKTNEFDKIYKIFRELIQNI